MKPLAIVPWPAKVSARAGTFELTDRTAIGASPGGESAARLLRSLLGTATGFPLGDGGETARVQLEVNASPRHLGQEGYELKVGTDKVRLVATSPAGLCNGAQTLRQLLPNDIYRPAPVRGARWQIPCVEVEDVPLYQWRGALLDVARHFAPYPFLLRFVDLLALHKANVLHLHLTDDQGWRFPSGQYPRLTEIGSWRTCSAFGHRRDPERRAEGQYDGTPHGGFYTPTQLHDLVTYAAERNITVVPEIDLPGHTLAAIAAYPALGNGVGTVDVGRDWGISTRVLNLEAATLQFCYDILSEVMDIFPSPFIHVGGDECPRTEWQSSPSAQQRIRAGDAAGIEGLQHWFTSELNAHLVANRRRLVGWDEILEGGDLPESAMVMSWRGEAGGVVAARTGHDVVMCPEHPCYFYHYQSSDPKEPLAAGATITLEDVYEYSPTPSLLAEDDAKRVLGAQFQLWREYMPTTADVEYMAFPRACAFSEAVWSLSKPGFGHFNARLTDHLERLDMLGVNFRPVQGPLPWQTGGSGWRRRVAVPQPLDEAGPVPRRSLATDGNGS